MCINQKPTSGVLGRLPRCEGSRRGAQQCRSEECSAGNRRRGARQVHHRGHAGHYYAQFREDANGRTDRRPGGIHSLMVTVSKPNASHNHPK